MTALIAALDVDYREPNLGVAAAVVFDGWTAEKPLLTHRYAARDVAPYEPGKFYLRELPCLLGLLRTLPVKPDIIIVDAHVWLAKSQAGLGARLFWSVQDTLPQPKPIVVGVAKSRLSGTPAFHVYRGKSRATLYVDAIGMEPAEAVKAVMSMHGPNRIPTMIRLADQYSREA